MRLKCFKFLCVFLLILNEVSVIIGQSTFIDMCKFILFSFSLRFFFFFIDGEARLSDPCSKEKVAALCIDREKSRRRQHPFAFRITRGSPLVRRSVESRS